VASGFWKLNSIFSLNIFNAEKSIGGHVQKPMILSFSTESHFTSQLDVERFRK